MSLADLSAAALLAEFPEPAMVMRPDGELLLLNPAALKLFELHEFTEGLNVTEFLPEGERSRLDPLVWMQRWAEQPDAPELQHVHLLCRTTSGRDIPVRVRVGQVRHADEVYYLVLLHDIAEQQARQQEERQAHRLAARVLAISADAVVIADESLTITYLNPSAEALFGYPGGTLVGQPLDTLLPAAFRAGHDDRIRQFAAESAPARLMGERNEILGLTASGEEIPLEASITKITLDRQLMFSAHLRDLRARKQAEADLMRAQARFQTVFDHALQAMALIDPGGLVLEMNNAARELMPAGADPLGQQFAELPFFSADPAGTRALLREAIDACLAGDVFRVPTEIQLPDGSTQQLDFSLSPVRTGNETFAMIAEARALIRPGNSGSA